ncbi:TPA: hypothetical protein KDX79_000154 [Vibrio parahaemolyticus]|nr:hypothetical protein [Vibrio parahaemolyticus]
MSKATDNNNELDFPDQRKQRVRKAILNTDENLKLLLMHNEYVPYLNYMTAEIETYHKGECLEYEEFKSRLKSDCARVDLPKATVDDHIHVLSKQRAYHPVVLYLDKSKWDGVERVQSVISYMRSKRPDVTELIMRRWLVACIAALYEPRFSSKLVPVIQSKQSFRKTAFLSRIGDVIQGAFVGGRALDPRSKDSVRPIIKSWIVELGELESSTKCSQGQLKAFISQEVDTIRPPYARTDLNKTDNHYLLQLLTAKIS